MSSTESAKVPITLGIMTWGEKGKGDSRVTTPGDAEKMLDLFLQHGHCEVDTSYAYNAGTSEEMLGKLDYKSKGVIVDTKLYPYAPATHKPSDIKKYLAIQFEALKTDSVDLYYLHGPDRNTPYKETMECLNEMHKEGKFKRIGLSNYMSWEVAEICTICRENGWEQPTVYQGIYNAVHRLVEPELLPCLRKFGMSFYAFNPLGGGFFTGQYDKEKGPPAGSRFDPNGPHKAAGFNRYWNDNYFNALARIKKVATAHHIPLTSIALRWARYNSVLDATFGDNLIIGASSLTHLEENLKYLEGGPLPSDIVKALDEAWHDVKPVAYQYWH